MGQRVDKTPRGLVLASDVFDLSNLAPVGAPGGLLSTYEARGAGPGQAESTDAEVRLNPAISGGQTQPVELITRAAGMPERGGVEMLWRLESENTDGSAWRSCTRPSQQAQWIAAVWSDLDPHETFDLVVTRDEQAIVCLFVETTGPNAIEATSFDFAAASPTWSPSVVASVDPYDAASAPQLVSDNVVAGCALPSGRVLAMGKDPNSATGRFAYASDDQGATWFQYAAAEDMNTTNPVRWRMAYYRGDVVLFAESAFGQIYQTGSGDLATTFQFVSFLDACGSDVAVDVLPEDAGLVLSYIRDADSHPVVRVISGAFSPFADALEVEVAAVPLDYMTSAIDGVGNVWVFGVPTATPNRIAVWQSTDAGQSFIARPDLYASNDADTFLRKLTAAFVRGWAVVAHTWTADESAALNGSIGTLWAGGWSSFQTQNWAGLDGIEVGITGIPIEIPSNMSGWALVGIAPTLEPPGELQFNTTGAVASSVVYQLDPGEPILAMFEFALTAGDGSSTTADVFFAAAHSDPGLSDHELLGKVDALNGRIRFLDVYGASDVGDIAIDVTLPVQVVISIDVTGRYLVLYKRPWATRWQRGPESAPFFLTNGGGALPASRYRFGHGSTGTNTSRWRQWCAVNLKIGTRLSGVGYTPAEPFGVLPYGGEVTGAPRPIPEVGSESAAAFLSATRGPGRIDEQYAIAPVFDYGADRLLPILSPSPDEPFRTVDAASEVVLVFEYGAATTLGPAWQWAFAFLRTNFKTAVVERAVIGLPWVAVGTYNAAIGFEGLTYSSLGNYMRPGAGTVAAGRKLRRNELAGGFAIFAGGVTRRIKGNGPGTWADPGATTTLFAEVELETPPPTLSGSVDLVSPNGVLLVDHTGAQPLPHSRYWRIRIPIQANPDGYVQIGALLGGSVAVFGKQWSRGWSREMRSNTSRRVTRYGTIRKRQEGPPARRWSMSWADGVNEWRIRDAASPDYLAHVGGTPLAMQDDVWTLLYGLLEETRGGEVPVVALAVVRPGVTSITDRTLFLYGSWDSSVQFNQVEGDEGDREFMRGDPITITEIR